MSNRRLFAKLGMQCITLFYILACGIQLLEVPGDLLSVDFRAAWLQFGEWNFFNSVYFVIVTLSTVGYGDFSPSTVQGRLFTLMIIIIGIVIFTTVIGEIVEQSTRGRGAGWFIKNPTARHVIICGNPTLTALVLFVSEFYSDTRETNMNAKLVVLVENPTWSDPEWFQYIAKNSFLQARLTFLKGNLRNAVDTQRAKLTSADAVFFLNSPSTGEDPALQDIKTVMNVLAVRNARTDIPIYVQTLLHDSNLQTNVALKRATSFSADTYFRDTKSMRQGASYEGLFHSVLRSEISDFAKVRLRRDHKEVEEAIAHYNELHGGEDAVAGKRKSTDLERSSLICLQEIQMALIAGNIKVNGLATLLSNMYVDIQAEKPSADDPSWLWEYQMGTSCSLQYAIIPEQLHGCSLKSIAVELFHVGLVLVGTSDTSYIMMHPVLGTDSFLRKGDIGVFLTYHYQDYVAAALHVVACRYRLGQLRHPILSTMSSQEDLKHTMSSQDPMTKKLSGISDEAQKNENAISLPNLDISLSSMNSRGPQEICEDIVGDDLLQSDARIEYERASDNYMPDSLSGHVIVVMEGDAALDNLALFLKNLWQKIKRRSMRKVRRAPVVVIHPCITDKYRELYAQHERKSLFFVEGSPSSADTWSKAKLKCARSVATMADYTRPWTISDARTIFTLLTLDVNTQCDHDLFICSELVDEKSLEFLREPSHPRRRGANLGELSLQLSANASQGRLSATPVQSPIASPETSQHFKGQQDGRQTKSVPGLDNKPEILPDAETANEMPLKAAFDGETNTVTPGSPSGGSQSDAKAIGNPVHVILSSAEQFKKSALAAVAGEGSVKSGGSRHSKQVRQKSFKLQNPEELIRENATTGVDPADKPGAARARRGSLFSRSRYASGELLIHSSAITLLVREYVEPGFINFISDVLGTVQPTPGLKIRLVQIPKSLFRVDRGGIIRNGQLFLPYISIFKSLTQHGATPLGIYRSGDAPVRVPFKNRHRRGEALIEELRLHWTGFSQPKIPSPTKAGGSLVQYLLGLVQDVSPQNMREAQGRDEINGGRQSSSSSEDYDSDSSSSNEDQETDKLDARGNGGFPTAENHKAGRDGTKLPSRSQTNVFETCLEEGAGDFEVPGGCKYKQRPPARNFLPYVFTMPEPGTLCAETDGIYILCHPSLELSDKWTENIPIDGKDKSLDE